MKRFLSIIIMSILLLVTIAPITSNAATTLNVSLAYNDSFIPSSTSLLGSGVVLSGKPTYRVTITATVTGKTNFSGATITFNNPASSTVVLYSTSTVTLSPTYSGGLYRSTVYATYDVRGTVSSFSCTGTIGGSGYTGSSTSTINVPVPAYYGPKFYMTYYIIASEADYSGNYDTAASGLSGKLFKSAFLAQVRYQGTGYSHYGEYMKYNGSSYYIVTQPTTATGTVPTVSKTIAVDPYYIPRLSSEKAKVNIMNVGTRQAEDGGQAITGCHIDVFYGTGLPSTEPSWNVTNQTVYYYGNNLW